MTGSKQKTLIFIFFLGLVWSSFAAGGEAWRQHQYTVVRITDGDTFVATDGNISFKVRIAGMDAPEKAQSYGKVAKTALSDLILNKKIQIKTVGNGMDQYGRILGIVFVEEKDVAKNLIGQGLATYYRPRCRDFPGDGNKYNYDPREYVAAEAVARKKKLNFWSVSNPELPCAFRKGSRS